MRDRRTLEPDDEDDFPDDDRLYVPFDDPEERRDEGRFADEPEDELLLLRSRRTRLSEPDDLREPEDLVTELGFRVRRLIVDEPDEFEPDFRAIVVRVDLGVLRLSFE